MTEVRFATTSRRAVLAVVPITLTAAFALSGCASLGTEGQKTMSNAITSHTLPVGADQVAYLKAGSGPALVIVHGVGGHKEDWQAVMAAFASSHTVYAIDMLGFGGSSRGAADLSMTAQANAILALLDREGIARADLIGNSVGGWVSATFAATNPTRVNRLVVADPAGFEAMFQGAPPVNLFPNSEAEMAKLLSFVLVRPETQTSEFAREAFARFQASGEKTIEARLGPALFGSARLEAVMPRISAPTLVVWGREDKLFPVALAPYITGLTPGATSAIIDNASHFPQIDQPEAFIAAVRAFLK